MWPSTVGRTHPRAPVLASRASTRPTTPNSPPDTPVSTRPLAMMGAAVRGKSLAEARKLIRAFKALMSIHESRLEGEGDGEDLAAELEGVKLGDLEALQGVVKFPVRIKCATLAWNTLAQGLEGEPQPA